MSFMSLYGFALAISGLRRISFDINGHPKTTEHCEWSHLIEFALNNFKNV